MRTSDMEDAELAALAHAGDRDAFGELVRRYAGQARRIARAMLHDDDDADDAAQDGFLAALTHMGRYDPSRPFGPWLLRIVANAAADRRRRRRVRETQPLEPQTVGAGPLPDRVTDIRGLNRALREALATLPERQRAAVVSFDVEGYSHREIGTILDIPEGTVRSDVFHGRRALRIVLESWKDWKREE